MYKIKKPYMIRFMSGYNTIVSKRIGINKSTLCRILSGKQATSYKTAYCITKMYNPEKEVHNYFKLEEKKIPKGYRHFLENNL